MCIIAVREYSGQSFNTTRHAVGSRLQDKFFKTIQLRSTEDYILKYLSMNGKILCKLDIYRLAMVGMHIRRYADNSMTLRPFQSLLQTVLKRL